MRFPQPVHFSHDARLDAAGTPDPRRREAWSPTALLGVLCALHVVLWTLVPALTYPAVPRDALEGIAWGRMWQLGYDKHPFLASWLSAAFTDAFGVVGWPVYLVSQLCVVLALWAVWRLARTLLDARRALMAVLLLEGIGYYNFSSFSLSSFVFNPNVVMLPTWAMLSLTVYRALLRPDLPRWCHAGVWAGLALLAKYESAILLLVLAGVLLATREGRRSLATPAFYAGVLVAVAVFSPNLIWLLRHDFITVDYALGRLDAAALAAASQPHVHHALYQPLLFLKNQLGYLLPALGLFLLLPRRRGHFDARRLGHVYVLALAVGPTLLTLLFALGTGGHLVTSWGFPFHSLLGVALLLFFVPHVDEHALRRFAVAVAGWCLVVVLVCASKYHEHPWTQATFPYRHLAKEITQGWRHAYGSPLRFVAGDRWSVAGVVDYARDKPVPYFGWDPKANPWLDENDLCRAGAVFLHEWHDDAADEALLRALRTRFPALTDERVISVARNGDAAGEPVVFWVAHLPPGVAGACAARLP